MMDLYNYYFVELGDKRNDDYLLVKTPFTLIGILYSYFMFVYYCGPRFMKSRKPYNIKNLIAVYNLVQVGCCFYILKSLFNSGFTLSYMWECVPVDYSQSENGVNMHYTMYLTFLLKTFELTETIFFILRKKTNQVSVLHVYHHASILTLVWVFVKYIPGGTLIFSLFANSAVHIIMYFYYFISTFDGIAKLKIVQLLKKSITIIEMIHIIMVLINSMFALSSSCSASRLFLSVYIPNSLVILIMYYNFYNQAYNKKQEQTRMKTTQSHKTH